MSENIVLGQPVTSKTTVKDAVHIAVISVASLEPLKPGDRISVSERIGKTIMVVKDRKTPQGIVDPYLTQTVKPGQKFWMCLLPGTVTGMRHEWEHPAFMSGQAEAETQASDLEAADSEKWLREYAARMNCYDDPGDAFDSLIGGLRSGNLFFHGSDLHGLYELEDADDLRFHGERYLGIRIDWDKFSFSCSC